MINTLLAGIALASLVGCASKPAEPSEQAKNMAIFKQIKELPEYCLTLAKVEGLGSTELEAEYDLAHNAFIKYQADTVLIEKTSEFHQNTRLHNYQRTPTLKAPKGTANYYYEDAFTTKKSGLALQCALKR
jgi:hypothetical protein